MYYCNVYYYNMMGVSTNALKNAINKITTTVFAKFWISHRHFDIFVI